jgi:hypothetical protein
MIHLEMVLMENVRQVIGTERILFSWILHGNLQITGGKKVTFKISVAKRKLNKINGSQAT